ncbi:unnamed protein product [Rhizophagus irregularis]|nr:unnamed protein product [Rhizophagus irregularis]
MTSTEPVTLPEQTSVGISPVKSSMADKQVPASESYEDADTECGDGKVNKAVNIQIPELSLEAILTGTSEVTAQIIVDLLRVTMKLRCKEILCWYCYYKAYEDRVRDVKSKNGVDDKSARTLVYSEIKPLLPDITDVNLHKITFRKKSIYCLMG